MQQLNIVAQGEAAAVVLSPALLAAAGLKVGDVLEATVVDHQLVLRSVPDAARSALMQKLTDDLFERRADAYQRLA